MHFSEMSGGATSPTELVGMLICEKERFLFEYATAGSERNHAMVDKIRQRLKLTSLQYQKLDDLVEAIGLPKDRLCTHCWDGSSYF
jgi:amidophosphoribosyltransferase